MVRLRNAVMAMALGAGVMGCSFAHYSLFHCDTCDDFPTPAYGPGYSMAPGTYTGPPIQNSLESNRPASSTPSSGINPSAAEPSASTPPATSPTPPPPPAASPRQGVGARQPAAGAAGSSTTVATGAEPALPPLPYYPRNDVLVPVATSGGGESRR